MNKLIAYSVRCCLAASAALLSTAPAHAQQAARLPFLEVGLVLTVAGAVMLARKARESVLS